MTITTEVRIDWPVSALRLLDHVTRTAGGDPETVRRKAEQDEVWNMPGQGLRTLAWVKWGEQPDTGYKADPRWPDDEDSPAPPALVILCIDNPYGGKGVSGAEVQALEILPAVVKWLDQEGVPRERWWWEDESAGTYHPGTCPVGWLLTKDPRPTWTPPREEPTPGEPDDHDPSS